jgi:hypothetical protein
MTDYMAVILGFIFRLVLPIGLTALAVWYLRKLDMRWQKEAGPVAIAAPTGTPCWERKNCSADKRAKCPACQDPTIPCWQKFRQADGSLRESCIDCDVFRDAPIPATA